MAHWRVQYDIKNRSSAKLDSDKTFLEAALAGKAIFDRPYNWVLDEDPITSDPRYIAHIRFDTKTDADTIYNQVKQIVSNLQINGTTGVVSIHFCPHGDPAVYDCRTDARAQYQEVVF